jgi:hypothetical protein
MSTLIIRTLAATFVTTYVAALSVVLGALALILIAHLTTATWFGVFRRRAELIVASLPAFAVLAVVLIPSEIVLRVPLSEGASASQRSYENAPFFIARTVVYWICWLLIAGGLRRAARAEEGGDRVLAARRFRVVSCAGLVALGVTMTFASFDWMMSLTSDWQSTIYGIEWFSGGMVGALSLIAVLAARRSDVIAFAVVPTKQQQALAKLLLTFVMFWIYIGFSQYIVMWSADVPREITWYVPRTHGAWGAVALALLVFGGVLPFCVLLLPSVRRSRTWIAMLGAVLLVAHFVDTCWMVMPALVPFTVWTGFASIAILIAVIVIAMAVAATYASRRNHSSDAQTATRSEFAKSS